MTGDAARRQPEAGPHFQQLYYTSCEHGLSGFSGFQFNAVSEGVTADTRQAVEALAGYEPPRSMVESDTPELLERCPVNLCYRPHDPRGRSATALCVRYAGRDSARRFGNYFAHALHSEDFPAAGRGLLGIELWGSPVWAGGTSPTTRIPVLTAPPRGPLDPRTVGGFLDAHPHAEQLPHLLAAAFAALTEHGSVVVVDRTTERIAHWFAAVCYLLPPPLARRLSFATYVFRPARSRLHLIGTVPEVQLDFGPDEEDAYTVFDFCRGRFPDDVHAAPDVHALVALLTRIGVAAVRPVWAWTKDFAHGAEESPGDWHAPVAAAASSGGVALAAADVDALLDWLPAAEHLGPLGAQVAADLHRRHRNLDDSRLRLLSGVARAADDTALHQEIEGRLLESRMRAHMTGAVDATEPAPLTDPDLRARATALWERLLRDEAATTRRRVRLLLWAHGARLAPQADIVERETLTAARALLGTSAPGAALRREVELLVAAEPRMRGALAAAVREVLESRPGQEQLFSQFPAALLQERDLRGSPLLLEHYWRARAEREPARTVELMFRILRVRGRPVPDDALLEALWRHPARTWTHREAGEIARGLPPEALADPLVGRWLDRAVNRRIETAAELDRCLELCGLLTAPDRWARLPADVRARVRTTLDLAAALRGAREATGLARLFAVPEADRWAAPQALKRYRLVPAMLRLPADIGALGELLGHTEHAQADRYLAAVQRTATGSEPVDDVRLSHVAAVAAAPARAGLAQAHLEVVDRIRLHAGRHWRLADLQRLECAVRPHDAPLADWFHAWAESRLSGPRRLAHRLPGLRRGTGGGRPRDDSQGTAPGGDGSERDRPRRGPRWSPRKNDGER
ncbi:GTPase-associated protein 1-related protein [Streptomyces sp. NPDC006992]|uniref:GTPase-associated protein 1-related protein n=1 Tax=Streptomyces sp. NPDC006992 TaxID=3155601 RepID=UPI003403E9D1